MRHDRILGALLGVHAGDALGASYEFSHWAELQQRFPHGIAHDIVGGGPFHWLPGHATDDTDMTRAVLLAYAETAGRKSESDGSDSDSPDSLELARVAAARMVDWFEGRWPGRTPGSQPVDAGGATRIGLAAFAQTGDPRCAGAGLGQAGNGSLMRCIPTALFARNADALVAESALVSAITHNDARCVLACIVYNTIVAALVDGRDARAAVDGGVALLADDRLLETVEHLFVGTTSASVLSRACLDDARTQVEHAIGHARAVRVGDLARLGPEHAPGGPAAIPHQASGYVLESLTLGIAALLDTGRSVEDLLVDVVTIGRDTDTNAAVAGGLLGARDGVEGIPRAWRDTLQFAGEFTHTVSNLN